MCDLLRTLGYGEGAQFFAAASGTHELQLLCVWGSDRQGKSVQMTAFTLQEDEARTAGNAT